MGLYTRRDDPQSLVVSMTGVKMGDAVVQIGGPSAARLAAVLAKVGLSGRAVALVRDQSEVERAAKAAERAGALVDIGVLNPAALAVESGQFDVAVVDDTDGIVASMDPDRRGRFVRELWRVLRPGGRVVFVGQGPDEGLLRFLRRAAEPVSFVQTGEAAAVLEEGGFRGARQLGAREGLAFAEALKPRQR
jgi:SAM-dependent methyltransferase